MTALTTGIIDVYHGDADAIIARGKSLDDALAEAKAGGVVCVIAKCAQGKDYVDPKWQAWADSTRKAGLIPGAYFFPSMTSAPEQQCDWFLRNVEASGCDVNNMILALDKERNPNPGGTITVANAEAWVQHFRDALEFWPIYYTNTSDAAHDISLTSVIRNCPLWVAAYGDFNGNPRTPWPWSIWQYLGAGSGPGEWPRDEKTYPRSFPGIGHVDANVFRGDLAEFESFVATYGT